MCPPVGGAVQITLNHTLLYKPKNWAIKHLDLIIYLNCLGCASLFRECMTLWITINVIFKLHNNIAHADAIKPALVYVLLLALNHWACELVWHSLGCPHLSCYEFRVIRWWVFTVIALRGGSWPVGEGRAPAEQLYANETRQARATQQTRAHTAGAHAHNLIKMPSKCIVLGKT